MGWFLPSGNKHKGKKARPARAWARASNKSVADPERRRARWKAALVAIVVVGLAIGGWFGYPPLRERVSSVRTTGGAAVDVRLHDLPVWMRPPEASRIARQVAQIAGGDPLNRAALAAAADYLQHEAWIERLNSVQRDSDGAIDVHVDWRSPAALVGARDGFHLIDASGVRLPDVYGYDQVADLGLVAITGIAAAPPRQGTTWPGADVQAGLSLVRLLAGRGLADQVKAVDVSNFAGRADERYPHLSLVTAEGMVRWGRAPGNEGIYEPAAETKLTMLRRVAERYGGRIDAGGQTVDVYLDTPMIHPRNPSVQRTGMRE